MKGRIPAERKTRGAGLLPGWCPESASGTARQQLSGLDGHPPEGPVQTALTGSADPPWDWTPAALGPSGASVR